MADGHEEAAEAGTSAYRGRGIATGMLKTLIEWARAQGWREIHASASRSIPPLMSWIGCLGVDSYLRLGSEVTAERCNEGFKEGVISQRQGHHGDAVKEMWEPFTDLSDEDARYRPNCSPSQACVGSWLRDARPLRAQIPTPEKAVGAGSIAA